MDISNQGAPWGLFYNKNWEEGGQNDIQFNIKGVELEDAPNYNCYDISSIENISNTGMTVTSGELSDKVTIETYRDEGNGDLDGFKIFPQNTAAGDMGFVEVENPIGGYKKGDVIPKALLNTLKIIEHRNTILSDSAVSLPIPYASDEMTETEHLNKLIADIIAVNNGLNKYSQFYYPAASLCYAYEPATKAGETLSPKFKAHKWAGPCIGDICRLLWYHLKGYEVDADEAIFARAVYNKVMKAFPNNYAYWSTTEGSAETGWNCAFGGGGRIYQYTKLMFDRIRPIVSF